MGYEAVGLRSCAGLNDAQSNGSAMRFPYHSEVLYGSLDTQRLHLQLCLRLHEQVVFCDALPDTERHLSFS